MAIELPRDRHLFGPGPKRILTIDGGGVRGAIAVAFLARIETLLAERAGRPVRLCDHFDLIAGTSTGSLVALALSLGYSAAELRAFYAAIAPKVFRRRSWRVLGLQAKFDGDALSRAVRAQIGDVRLDSPALQTGLAIVTKRLDTGSTWLLSNNPRAPYWDDAPDGRYIGNRRFDAATVVRASAAAPHYFDPQLLPITPGGPDGLFIDGGLTPHNNPALAAFLMVRASAYGLCWPATPQALHIVSLGTGAHRVTLSAARARRTHALGLAFKALTGLVADGSHMVLTMMQWMGDCPRPGVVNSEVGTLAGERPGTEKLFRFVRYDVGLDAAWLQRELGMTVGASQLAAARELDNPGTIELSYAIGTRAAERQVTLADLDFAAADPSTQPGAGDGPK